VFDRIEDNAFKRRVKNHVIGREHDFFAVVQPGFEKRAEAELADTGLVIKDYFIEGGVEFSGRLDSCYRASLLSRTAGRILMRIAAFRSANYFEIERLIRSFPWELYIFSGSKINYRISASKSMIYHTGKLEEIFNAGINERLAGHGNSTGSNEHLRAQALFLRNSRDLCQVSIDASGEFLHKRGAGKNISRAPLRETTASLILLEAGIGNYSQLLDPMCGSGTFSLEAASIITKTPPAIEREFPFLQWPCFRESAFRYVKNEALKKIIPQEDAGFKIITSDIDPESIKITESNIPDSFGKIIKPAVADFFSLPGEIANGRRTLIVLNPPYGKRIEDGAGKSIFGEIGKKIRKDFSGCGYAVIVPGHEKENILGLGFDRKIPFMNGGIKAAVIFKDA